MTRNLGAKALVVAGVGQGWGLEMQKQGDSLAQVEFDQEKERDS